MLHSRLRFATAFSVSDERISTSFSEFRAPPHTMQTIFFLALYCRKIRHHQVDCIRVRTPRHRLHRLVLCPGLVTRNTS